MVDLSLYFNCENINNYVCLEGMTSISALINGIRTGVNNRIIRYVLIDQQKMASRSKDLSFLKAVSDELSFEIIPVDRNCVDQIANGNTHGGIIALCTDRSLPFLHEKIKEAPWNRTDGFFVILEGVEDPYNFGYALRALYAAGVDGVILSPRNWMSAASVVARSSAGASELLPMAISDSIDAAKLLKSNGYRVICAGIRDSVPMTQSDMKRPLLLVVGGEKRGISRALLEQADQIVRIEYGRAFRGSLSTASATTVLAFEALRQNSY